MTATEMSQPVGLERVTISSVTSPFARYRSRRRFLREGGQGGAGLNNELGGTKGTFL
jgi:hypothetical protein